MNVMLGMIFDHAKVDIPREKSVLSVTFLVSLELQCNLGHIDRMRIQQKVLMKNALSSIVILTLLLTKPGGTVMDKASVLEVFRYRSP